MSAKSPHSVLAQMMNSGEFSDLTLACQGEEFKVHKAVVCGQSPVIKAAIEGGFEESHTNVIRMDACQPATVKRLVQFMYTGDYDAPEAEHQALLAELLVADDVETVEGAATAQSQLHTGEEGSSDSPMSPPDGTAKLLQHIRMNAIGDYYGMPELVLLANTKIKHLLQESRDETLIESLPATTETAITSTGDDDLHDIFASAIAANISKNKIVDMDEFKNLGVMTEFPVKVLKSCAKEFKVLGEKHNTSCKVQAEDIFKLMTQNSSMKRCLNILNKTDACRNVSCRAEFKCVVDSDEDVVRCTRCRCRHS